ncbi:hypothetical protein SASPL_116362 [Salvia splendens]|uniref:Uncharacterized protein n=1 Tax=Salvia splendens TaxID=180675 RepID=A0A8X8XSR5_SALSN|nr:hypothetical protein SASPL_116362 [Salvia splendens]
MPQLAGFATGEFRRVHKLRIAEHNQPIADDVAGVRVTGHRKAVHLVDQAAVGIRFTIGFQIRVAPRRIRAAIGWIADPIVGAAAGDTLPPIDRRVREPLQVEFGGGELEPGGSDRRVAAGGGSVYNARMLAEEMGVCVEVARGVESSVSREDVRTAIEALMGAAEMRRKSAAIGELIRAALTEESGRKGSSLQAADDFVTALLSKR